MKNSYNLYDYQEKAVSEVLNNLDKKTLLVLPPGTGKTIISAELVKIFVKENKKVLFISPYLEILKQVEEKFIEHGINMENVTVIGAISASYNLQQLPNFDIIITDEAHHSMAPSYQNIYKQNPNATIISFTATPYRLDNKKLDSFYDYITDLGLNTKWFINHGYLSDCLIYSPDKNNASKKIFNEKNLNFKFHKYGDFSKSELDNSINKTYGDIVNSYKKFGEGRKAILYAHSLEYAHKYAKLFNKAKIKSCVITGAMGEIERQKIIEAFKTGNIKVLCNVNVIAEGFDMPDAYVSILARPTLSRTLYIQQAMRCMRPKKDGEHAIIIDHTSNTERFGSPIDDYDWLSSNKKSTKKKINDEELLNLFLSSNNDKRARMVNNDQTIQLRLFRQIQRNEEFNKKIEAAISENCLEKIIAILSEYNVNILYDEEKFSILARIIEKHPRLLVNKK